MPSQLTPRAALTQLLSTLNAEPDRFRRRQAQIAAAAAILAQATNALTHDSPIFGDIYRVWCELYQVEPEFESEVVYAEPDDDE